MNINIVEERLDKLIKDCELKPDMFFADDQDFLSCYSYFMYLKFDIKTSYVEKKLVEYFNININSTVINKRQYSCFIKPDFQDKIKIFRRTLENMIFE